MTTLGVEEEYMFLDPTTLRPAGVAEAVRSELLQGQPRSRFVAHEFLASQIERSTPVFHTLEQAAADLSTFRRRLQVAASQHHVVAASIGTPFDSVGRPEITEDTRYQTVESEFRGVVADHLVNGVHVHVAIPDRTTGVHVLNRIRVWLPTLLSLVGNSPFWHATDTGFASWRAMQMRRWSTIGCPPPFRDGDDYDDRIRRLVGVGGTYDLKTIAWNARLSEANPTVEVRVGDAQLDVAATVLLAALVRGLVSTAIRDTRAGIAPLEVEPELLDAALWHAARDGISGLLLNPATRRLEPAAEVVGAMVDSVAEALETEGDVDTVHEQIARILVDGTGATRQRAAMRAGGRKALGRLFATALASRYTGSDARPGSVLQSCGASRGRGSSSTGEV
ncbi:hypothetical protein ASD65_08730 [Microbacterium sp. Root61]|uniref:carboxylate-amine ligase n=1 Tax=Microbacterium sp. Root61 TaxID=1736570 RepID=UPI0006FC2FF1|nr:glutamate--cysteine ligase [Microbacterium sp. Root61]KRA24495.1 hypothetical protein ASD65_08730 [Microbacterium sp. Root61]